MHICVICQLIWKYYSENNILIKQKAALPNECRIVNIVTDWIHLCIKWVIMHRGRKSKGDGKYVIELIMDMHCGMHAAAMDIWKTVAVFSWVTQAHCINFNKLKQVTTSATRMTTARTPLFVVSFLFWQKNNNNCLILYYGILELAEDMTKCMCAHSVTAQNEE